MGGVYTSKKRSGHTFELRREKVSRLLQGKGSRDNRVRSDSRKEQGLENSVAEASFFPEEERGERGFEDAQGKKRSAESDASLEGLDRDNPQGPGMCTRTQ